MMMMMIMMMMMMIMMMKIWLDPKVRSGSDHSLR